MNISKLRAALLGPFCLAHSGCDSKQAVERVPANLAARTPAQPKVVSSGQAEEPPSGECDASPLPSAPSTRFALIGDYGMGNAEEAAVARLVKSWNPEFVITAGDNNYPSGGADTIDAHIGQFFREFICPYRGGYGAGATRNRFFPALGNHDWYTDQAAPYLDYFTLPGNERYYDVVWRNVQVFALDSDPREPDGIDAQSRQAAWFKSEIEASSVRWKVVTMHHPPYTSGPHQSTLEMQWPYREWGADLVLAGHDHTYERLNVNGLTYVVMGLSGAPPYGFNPPLPESEKRYTGGFGAALLEATEDNLTMQTFRIDGERIDTFTLSKR